MLGCMHSYWHIILFIYLNQYWPTSDASLDLIIKSVVVWNWELVHLSGETLFSCWQTTPVLNIVTLCEVSFMTECIDYFNLQTCLFAVEHHEHVKCLNLETVLGQNVHFKFDESNTWEKWDGRQMKTCGGAFCNTLNGQQVCKRMFGLI